MLVLLGMMKKLETSMLKSVLEIFVDVGNEGNSEVP